MVKTVPGTSSAYAERVIGGYYLDIVPDRDRLARYGLMVDDVQDVVSRRSVAKPSPPRSRAASAMRVTIRYPRDLRSDPQAIATRRAGPLPMAAAPCRWAKSPTSSSTQGPTTIRTENAQLAAYVFVDIRGRDLGGYVADARQAVAEQVSYPPGTYVLWSGQFEYLERAEARLKFVVPVTLLLIFLLLYLNFRRITETLIVMLSLPFALVGGFWLMWWLGSTCRVAVAVGFIALAGVAAETGVVMLIYLDHALRSVQAECARPRPAVHPRRPPRRDHGGRRRTRAAQDDDGGGDHGGTAADPVEHRHRLGGHAAHRGADDRRHGVLDAAYAAGHSRDLRAGQGVATSPTAADGEISRRGCHWFLTLISGSCPNREFAQLRDTARRCRSLCEAPIELSDRANCEQRKQGC